MIQGFSLFLWGAGRFLGLKGGGAVKRKANTESYFSSANILPFGCPFARVAPGAEPDNSTSLQAGRAPQASHPCTIVTLERLVVP